MPERFKKRLQSADAAVQEAAGLRLLQQTAIGTGLSVPTVFDVQTDGTSPTLTMTAIVTGDWGAAQWRQLGSGLASLHAARSPPFGLGEDNYIGRNPQRNGWCSRWGEFFVARRLQFQIGLVRNRHLQRKFEARLEAVRPRLVEYLNTACDVASLVHGDLWHGNVLCGSDGQVWLIDPAVHVADREVDLAMTELFGGFAPDFYRAYDAVCPRSADYPRKREIYNLYHNLNHFNLFGAGWLAACERGFSMLDRL